MKQFRKLVVLAVFFIPLNLCAGEVNFSGFATLAGGILFDESTTNTTITDDEISYEGYDDQIGFNAKSLIGLQASAELADGWGFTTQFIARGSESWQLNAEWAFLSYDATDSWRLLFGRQRAPFYMYSDFLDVSYAYHWITPPSGVYSLPFDVIDGVGSIYKSSMGDVDSTVHITLGRNRGNVELVNVERTADFSDFFSASWTLNYDWLTVRASYARTKMSIEMAELEGVLLAWNNTPFSLSSIEDGLVIKDDNADFSGIGFTVDYNEYLLVGEYTRVDTGDNFFPEQKSYYVSAGYRFDTILVHLTYGADEDTANFGIYDQARTISALAPLVSGLEDLTVSTVQEDSSFYTLGMRWDVSDAVALKVEYTRFEDDDKFAGGNASLFQTALTTVF